MVIKKTNFRKGEDFEKVVKELKIFRSPTKKLFRKPR